ncbi:MarR family transcriptional regulator [Streptomyces albofaciens JCM 4342]|uniref:MarR family winged helix-turn-helix transcriptional regulator n=1 Tax=Streptomyces albofaciens TaxID=66866 RepID=UPI00123C2318|nr:MarR family transcriptional regulator [Streptomyces albofaciens]KAA6223505.1 MarR family transcriptional regulator [Streptomyces albofaciens JCM 4342]
MPKESESIRAALGRAVQAYQGAVDDFDREVARLLGVNETDLRCLELLLTAGSATPGELGGRLGLTTGSVTAMIDRLEKRGYLARTPHPTDRRSTLVQPTSDLRERAGALMMPFVEDSAAQVHARFSDEQLALVVDFLDFNREVQERHTERLRAVAAPKRGGGKAAGPASA